MTCRTAIRGRSGTMTSRAARRVAPGAVRRSGPAGRLRWGLLGLLVGLLIGGAQPGAAAASDDRDGARRLVDAAIRDTLQVLAAPQLSRADTAQRLHALLDRYVDLPRVGRDSLGAYWRRATPEQQSGFLALLASFLATGYSDSVVKLGGLQFGPTAVVESDDAVTVVRTEVQVPSGDKHAVLFMVGRSDDGDYRVVDVVAAAISLSKLLNADFGAVLHSNGGRLDALNNALEHKLATTTQPAGAP